MNIRDTITDRRRERIRLEGNELGIAVPVERSVPLVPFASAPAVICEIKRRSPSKGDIAPGLDARTQAGRYVKTGIQSVSVLTEEDHFGGSLRDLIEVKQACPELALLRKDFLVDQEDVRVSWRAGADAILLIAGILSRDLLGEMYREARDLGMACLVEVHSEAEVDKVRPFKPELIGINSRDLTSFRVDPLLPMAVAEHIDWNCRMIFESGIASAEDARTAFSGGFAGLLVGESVVRSPSLIGQLLGEAERAGGTVPAAGGNTGFWRRLAGIKKRKPAGRPLVKICGITNEADAETAVTLGADIIGFVFAESPRQAGFDLPRKLMSLNVLKVGVVAGGPEGLSSGDREEMERLLDDGCLDALQLHGDEKPEHCMDQGFPYYKAIRLGTREDLDAAARYRSPRVLFDAYSSRAYGGTGRTVAAALLEEWGERPLWLAGGLGPENIAGAIRSYWPELIDASSKLETEPGMKSKDRMEDFFNAIDREFNHHGSK